MNARIEVVFFKFSKLIFFAFFIGACSKKNIDATYCSYSNKPCVVLSSDWINNELMNERSFLSAVKNGQNYMRLVYLDDSAIAKLKFDKKNTGTTYPWGTIYDLTDSIEYESIEFINHFKNFKLIKDHKILIYCDDFDCLNDIRGFEMAAPVSLLRTHGV